MPETIYANADNKFVKARCFYIANPEASSPDTKLYADPDCTQQAKSEELTQALSEGLVYVVYRWDKETPAYRYWVPLTAVVTSNKMTLVLYVNSSNTNVTYTTV